MALLADYEQLGLLFGLSAWLVLSILALFLGVVGIVVGFLPKPRRKLARWLGGGSCLIELVGITLVWLGFSDARARVGVFGGDYLPDGSEILVFWVVSALILGGGFLALILSGRDPRQGPHPPNQD